MWLVMKMLWKSLARILRKLGWGALLVPVAALGIVLFGLHLWTAAAVLVALVVWVWRPSAAAALLPVTMVAAGIAGLAVASAAPQWQGGWQARTLDMTVVGRGYQYVIGPQPGGKEQRLWVPPGAPLPPQWVSVGVVPQGANQLVRQCVTQAALSQGSGQAVFAQGSGQAKFSQGPGKVFVGLPRQLHAVPRRVFARGPCKPVGWAVVAQRGPRFVPPGWWDGRVLVPLALILLTLGLWLAPRTMVGVVDRAATLVQRLRQHMRENRWGVLLVPVTLFGLTVFGVRPWTVAMVIAAVIVAVKWPKVAADLVPVTLAAFALYGFEIASKWQSTPWFASAASFANPQQYGAVLVDSRQTALLAGAEASVLLALGAWLVPRTIGAHLRTVFSPEPDGLAVQVQRLTESRGHAISAATTELRRIERDLHDGAQARLVALGMSLRAVERMLPASPEAAMALVAEARETSLRALSDLRSLVRGIYPPVLADRGLGHAIQALALDTPMPTELDIDLPGRPPAPVESACYFAVAEALANAVKHSGARRVHVRVQHASGMLRIEVADDGIGGADLTRGTGLSGIERRLGTFDGILAVSSRPGGPTMIIMEVPCALSSPKTSSS